MQIFANRPILGTIRSMFKHQPRFFWILVAPLVVGMTTWLGSLLGSRFELRQQTQQLGVDVVLRRELLRSEIERHRLLPTTLARNPQLGIAVDRKTPESVS